MSRLTDKQLEISVGYWLAKIALAGGAGVAAYVACVYRIPVLLISALTPVLAITVMEKFYKYLRGVK